MRDSVPTARYSSVRNVLRLWSISLIPTDRVYGLYDYDYDYDYDYYYYYYYYHHGLENSFG